MFFLTHLCVRDGALVSNRIFKMRNGSQFEFSPTVTITKIVVKPDLDVLFQNQKYLRNQKKILVTLIASNTIKNTSKNFYCLKMNGLNLVQTDRPWYEQTDPDIK